MRSIALAVSAMACAGFAFGRYNLRYESGVPRLLHGTGCVNAGWTVSNNGTTEPGLTGIVRFFGPLPKNGSIYTAPAPVGPSGDALRDFSFSIDTQPGGVGSTSISDYTYNVSVMDRPGDVNISTSPLLLPDNSTYGNTGIQNSENLEFANIYLGQSFDPNAIDTYTITLTESSGQTVDKSVSIEINATPEPGTILLFGTGLVGLDLAARRRARKS